MSREAIEIKGARTHNLKNVSVSIPRNSFTVVTGVSGSGKSSLTIDTLYAEGQRRYVESLSSYARQFLDRMNKPEVDQIKGICPAIAIEQRTHSKTSRSTVGSLTELYDYLRLLFSRIGHTYSPISGKEIKRHRVTDVVDYVLTKEEGDRIIVCYHVGVENAEVLAQVLDLLMKKGFTRFYLNQELYRIDEYVTKTVELEFPTSIYVLVDRLVITNEEDEAFMQRLADSIQTAFYEGHGECSVSDETLNFKSFNNRFELDGIVFNKPTVHFFNFNNPYGACKKCEGWGTIIGVDPDLVIPKKGLSVYEGAVTCWRGEKMKAWKQDFIKQASAYDFPIHRPISELSNDEYRLLWDGDGSLNGIYDFFDFLDENSYKIQYRVMMSRYRGRTICTACSGSRLREETDYVKVGGRSLSELLFSSIHELNDYFENLDLNEHDSEIAQRILIEVKNRLGLMLDVGLGYLTLNRRSGTLSGGETQRISLTKSLGSNLTNSMYILDEPSIGLHPRDTARLISVLQSLKKLGNTVVVVEHDEDIMCASDYLIDMGPHAGRLGGEVVFQGPSKLIAESKDSLTAKYLSGKMEVENPFKQKKPVGFIEILGATEHNLKNVDAKLILNGLNLVTGVSGSGKTTLIKDILYPAMKNLIEEGVEKPGSHIEITGDFHLVRKIELIDQNPIGRSSRSNPVTYIKAYDAIRELYSQQRIARQRAYKPKHFSFNVDGGRCDVCKGEGETVVEMQFLADIHLTCESCNGKRFKKDVLEVTYHSKSISDVLDMTVEEALVHFQDVKEVYNKLIHLADVGLDYVRLGQSSSTLSGGEAQRVKLASFLTKGSNADPILFIFDEPTTGLHFHDISKLLNAFQALINNGHTIIIIEHNLDVIKCADWIIDLGPEGGDDGGQLMYQGDIAGLLKNKASYTAEHLRRKLGV